MAYAALGYATSAVVYAGHVVANLHRFDRPAINQRPGWETLIGYD